MRAVQNEKTNQGRKLQKRLVSECASPFEQLWLKVPSCGDDM